ncbi:MAG: TPM domain-containing protein [Candidatus Omnitrophica bacterium]|nr:TPM domain-containing protein [Candidatus Omnitrophota bacterium]
MVERKLYPKLFFTSEERSRVVEAIRSAEAKTSGEIRVHLERCSRGEVVGHARKMFERLGMTNTKNRNGILIYFSIADHTFAVLGDQGIHERVGDQFWKDVAFEIQNAFSRGEFLEGLIAGIHQIGESLKIYFPRESGDINELPDEVK